MSNFRSNMARRRANMLACRLLVPRSAAMKLIRTLSWFSVISWSVQSRTIDVITLQQDCDMAKDDSVSPPFRVVRARRESRVSGGNNHIQRSCPQQQQRSSGEE